MKRARMQVAAALCASGLVGAAACGACGESGGSGQPTPPEAGPTDAGADLDTGSESGKTDADADAAGADAPWDSKPNGCAPFDPPPAVPAGWERWNGWSCDCPLYVPGPNAEMPKAIEWEPCQESIADGLACRRMKHFWNETGQALSFFPRMSVDPSSGTPVLAFGRVYYGGDADIDYRIIAEVDGPVRNAFLKVNPAGKGCGVFEEGLNEGRYLLSAYGDTWDGPLFDETVPIVEGFLAGIVGEPYPSAVLKLPADHDLLSTWAVSPRWLVQRKGVRKAWSWDLQTTHTIYDPGQDPEHLPGGRTIPIGEEVIVEVGDGLPAGVMTWNVNDGLRPLLRWFGDGSQGAGSFGTDGKDMVWTYFAGADIGEGKYETMSVMTAPFTTSSAEAKANARRLRSDIKGTEPLDSWVVGCGYAARAPSVWPWYGLLLVVRLSDGVSWLLPGKIDPIREQWGQVLGITCEEVFASVSTDQTVRILRVRLDSLGPGTPPD